MENGIKKEINNSGKRRRLFSSLAHLLWECLLYMGKLKFCAIFLWMCANGNSHGEKWQWQWQAAVGIWTTKRRCNQTKSNIKL